MMRDEVLAQLMESVCLLEMVEEVLSSQEPADITEALARGMRITLQNIREGITESCEWVASVEEETPDESPADEDADQTADEAEDDAVIAEFIAEERRAEAGARAREVAVTPPLTPAGEARHLGGRTLLESILRQGPSAAEVIQQRHQIHRSAAVANPQSDRWSAASSAAVSSQLRTAAPVTASVERRGEVGFILDSLERILE